MSAVDIGGDLDGSELKVGVVVTDFNAAITEGLLEGALGLLEESGTKDVTVVRVPGALELSLVAARLATSGFDAVVCLGAVIEGETDHYTHVSTQAVAGLQQVALQHGIPITNGVLTVRELKHATERSRPGPGNKGAEAAAAAVRTAQTLRSLR